jgi:hypothetical protein
LGIDVSVYNPARVPINDLIRAKGVAAHIFTEVRINVMWVAGLMFSEVHDKSHHPEPPIATDLEVRIFTRAMLKPVVVAHDVLGITLLPDVPSSTRAVVIYDNILENARFGFIDPIRLLGLTMAHEVGHLLLQGHSPAGIMQARWLAKDLPDRNGFLFTRAEADSMRSEVKRRMEIHLARRE